MTRTRKHFERAAKIINTMAKMGDREGAKGAMAAFTLFFHEDGPKFDADRFVAACGVPYEDSAPPSKAA